MIQPRLLSPSPSRSLLPLCLSLAAAIAFGCQQRSPFVLDDWPERPVGERSARAGSEQLSEAVTFEFPSISDLQAQLDEDAEALSVSVEEAVMFALTNNRGLRVEQLQPMIVETFEDRERARFDPVLEADVLLFRQRGGVRPAPGDRILHPLDQEQLARLGVVQEFPTGTAFDLSVSPRRVSPDGDPTLYDTRLGLTLTQALLQGASWEANLASIEQARLDTEASEYELRAFAEALVADVEITFWEYLLAEREIEIFQSSLEVAEQQLDEAEQSVEVGRLAPTEVAVSRAEVAQRREELIRAHTNRRRIHLRMIRLMNPGAPAGWDLDLQLRGDVETEPLGLDAVEEHAKLALQLRPELNETRIRLEQNRLEVIRTRDGLLPRLDFFLALGKTGYADSFGETFADLGGRGYDLEAGIQFTYPLGNRAARAEHRGAQLARRQAAQAVHNLAQLVDLDVRDAHLEVEGAIEEIDATRATREHREEALRAEVEKFRVGDSTAFLVAQAQRDLLESQIAETRAMVNYRQALIELYRLDGSLLERRAIVAPGDPARRDVEIQ